MSSAAYVAFSSYLYVCAKVELPPSSRAKLQDMIKVLARYVRPGNPSQRSIVYSFYPGLSCFDAYGICCILLYQKLNISLEA